MTIERGDGVGIEIARSVLRAARLSHEVSGVAAAAEVPLHDPADDRRLLDALVRARALLGNPSLPTRIALFPATAAMWRVDITGRTGDELRADREALERTHGVTSTIIVDDAPRRWVYALRWDPPDVRRIEDTAERAGLLDVAIEPSPLALARVCSETTTIAERIVTPAERYVVALDGGLPVAAATFHANGATDARLFVGADPFERDEFSDVTDPFDIAARLVAIRARQTERDIDLQLNRIPYPRFPRADLRSPERQCVALGAALGAAGLGGRLRPIDVVAADERAHGPLPWAIERVSSLPPLVVSDGPGATRRLTARVVPRRRK